MHSSFWTSLILPCVNCRTWNHKHYLNLAGGKGSVSQGFFGTDMIAMEGAKKNRAAVCSSLLSLESVPSKVWIQG